MLPNDSEEYNRSKINVNNYCKILDKTIRLAKKNYFHSKFEKFKFDIRKTWKCINEVLSRKKVKQEFPSQFKINGNLINDKQNIANEFNEYFTNIGPKLSQMIETPSNNVYREYLTKNITSTFDFVTVSEETISKTLLNLTPKTSCGHDQLSSQLLQSMSTSICPILTHMINQSLRTGIFPDRLKIAKVLPFFQER